MKISNFSNRSANYSLPNCYRSRDYRKRYAENLCLDRQSKASLQIVIARCFSFVGPHLPLDSHFAVGNFIRDALAGNPIFVKGDGTPLRSYLYASDLAAWLWTLLLSGQASRIYNVGSDQAISIADLADLVAQVIHETFPDLKPHVHLAKKIDTLGVAGAHYVPSVGRIQDELGVCRLVSLRDAIAKTLISYHK